MNEPETNPPAPEKTPTGTILVEKTLSTHNETKSQPNLLSFEEMKEISGIDRFTPVEHYKDVKTIGMGGVGAVLRSKEPNLGREVALKILRPNFRNRRQAVERFLREARATAQIEHPNIVPVHELGLMDGIGFFFSMKKISGENLGHIIAMLSEKNSEYVQNYSRLQLLEIFVSSCQGVAFAHTKGVIHRDLKPENIMVGAFGEVLVMDWGLVKNIAEHESENNVNLDLSDGASAMHTMDGAISGTPLFMPPEQAKGKTSEIDQRSDIYSLGAILYSILTLKSSPFDGHGSISDVLHAVIRGDFISPRNRAPELKIPLELEAVCLKAMAHDKAARYQSVQELIRDIQNYMEGRPVSAYRDSMPRKIVKSCLRHPVMSTSIGAALLVAIGSAVSILLAMHLRYLGITEQADQKYRDGNEERHKAEEIFKELNGLESARAAKEPGRREVKLKLALRQAEAAMENNYNTAFMLYSSVPALYENSPRINAAFREIMKHRIDYSLMTRNEASTQKCLNLIRIWLGKEDLRNIPDAEDRKYLIEVENKIKGDGSLEVRSNPVSAEISVETLAENADGILLPGEKKYWGTAPTSALQLPRGSYLVTAISEGRPPVRYPVKIDRSEKESVTIEIPRRIPAGMCYVPAGKFIAGGEHSRDLKEQEVFLPGFFIKTKELSFAEYLEFWRSLRSSEEKQKYRGRIQLNADDRQFLDAWNEQGQLRQPLRPELPIVGITRQAAEAYCRWLSAKLGRSCRLPSAIEWEKAARGARSEERRVGKECRSRWSPYH